MYKGTDNIIGWDIGGAHLKAVLLDSEGNLLKAQQIACPLWLGLDKLDTAISQVLNTFDMQADQASHAITMTGELVDLFANRHEGVMQIAQLATSRLGGAVGFYCVRESFEEAFLDNKAVPDHTSMIASANWHASARLLTKYLPNALLLDVGSTTTDIIAIRDGKVNHMAYTDAKRMQQDTLVYTGVVRTPVMAVAQKLLLNGVETNVAAEHFATMADVYRLTEELENEFDMVDSADGEPKTILGSARRLARMVGHDYENNSIAVWAQLAQDCRAKQLAQIKSAALKQLKDGMVIVGAGVGQFLVKALADDLSYPHVNFTSLLEANTADNGGVCLPAFAVAKLAFLKRTT